VGTTNRTRLRDYERAIDDGTAALLKVHASNYRIEGFVEAVSIAELAELGRRRGLPVIHDVGSGLLRPLAGAPGLEEEPDAAGSIAAGADVVLFSGDKLLGGPQAGIIVGRRDLVETIETAPLMRALRVDKVTLAALGATLQLHLDSESAMRDVPVLEMITAPVAALEARAHAVARGLDPLAGRLEVRVTAAPACTGGGSLPAREVPSVALRLRARALSEEELARRLRMGATPVLARVGEGAVWLDLRTVPERRDEDLARAVREALG
jgi:L-seryl-tRNA(Ser) seleniumtransferase